MFMICCLLSFIIQSKNSEIVQTVITTSTKPQSPTKTPLSKRRKLANEEIEGDIITATPDKHSNSSLKAVLRRSPRHQNKTINQVVSPVRRSPRLMKKNKELGLLNSGARTSFSLTTPKKHITLNKFSTKQIYIDGSCNNSNKSHSAETKSGFNDRNHGLINRNGTASERRLNPGKIMDKVKNRDSCLSSKDSNVVDGISFKVPAPTLQNSMSKQSPLNNTNSTMKFTKSILKTPDISISSAMKATPPMCKCGRRSKRRLVQSPGPNLGRFFFSCSGVKSADRNGCGFFQWESPIQNSGSSSRHQSFVSMYNVSGLSKPFTPVFQQGGKSNSNVPPRRSLGVRPSGNRTSLR